MGTGGVIARGSIGVEADQQEEQSFKGLRYRGITLKNLYRPVTYRVMLIKTIIRKSTKQLTEYNFFITTIRNFVTTYVQSGCLFSYACTETFIHVCANFWKTHIDIVYPCSSYVSLQFIQPIYVCIKLFEGGRSITLFVISASVSSVNRNGHPVLFLSATDLDLWERVINLTMVELLGTSTFGYFTQNSSTIWNTVQQ